MPRWFRGTPLRAGVLAFLIAMLTFQVVRFWPDAYAIGRFFIVLLTVTTGVGIVLAIVLHQRAWCSLCPIGTLSSWVGKNRDPLKLDRDLCVDCGLCSKNCPMQLSPREMKEAFEMGFRGDCLKCGLCIKGCPKNALTFS